MIQHARFYIGQIVQHRHYYYRGVVTGVDFEYGKSKEFYENKVLGSPDRNKPWYYILIDGGDEVSYIAEEHLDEPSHFSPVNHPLIESCFTKYEEGRYHFNYHS